MAGWKARLLGLVAIAAGVGVGWYFGLGPLREAQAGAPSVRFDVKAFIFAPMAVVTGLFLVVGGRRVAEACNGPPRGLEQNLIVWTMFALAMAAGGVGWMWFHAELDALGYGG